MAREREWRTLPAPCVCADVPLCNQHKWAEKTLRAAYAAGLERAAVIADGYGDAAGVGDEIAAAIRQEGR